MEQEALLRRKQQVIDAHGAWTAHNFLLADGVYTRGDRAYGDEYRLRRVVQIVADVLSRPFDELRVLDLACLEGLYSIEFGRRGAEVVGIEGRRTNIEKARFAKEALALDRVDFVHDDVRNLSVERYGRFDVVLCIGILYHLDAPDVFELIGSVGAACTRLAIVDTHVALSPRTTRTHKGHTYSGVHFVEHSSAATQSMRERSLWASLDNPRSYWLTRPSLCNAITHAGFTTVLECNVPPPGDELFDRITLVATKGGREQLAATSVLEREHRPTDLPEQTHRRFAVNQSRLFLLLSRLVLDARAWWERLRERRAAS